LKFAVIPGRGLWLVGWASPSEAHRLNHRQKRRWWARRERAFAHPTALAGRQSENDNAMKLKLHHVNFATTDVAAMDKFYRDVLDMRTIPDMGRNRKRDEGYPGDVAFVTDGAMQMHIAEKDMAVGFRTGKVVNPVQRGHIAFRTDDLDAFKKRLDGKGIKYSDFGDWAMAGWKQIFFYDPDGNVVEVHQAPEGAP
jgi:catechol 2,3-dioxygenase-like lactoylglutathione lyase family enzyme